MFASAIHADVPVEVHDAGVKPAVVFHFSEDPTIKKFVPHVPRSNPEHWRAVWAIDAEHAPLYWFPRDCPRVTMWPLRATDLPKLREQLVTTAARVHAIESAWLERMRGTTLYRYEFDAEPFSPWEEANGQWITDREVIPTGMEPVGDLVQMHVDAGIELRIVPSLWPLHDLAVRGDFDFSIVRMMNAQPRPGARDALAPAVES